MPIATIKDVLSFSSEDSNFPAANLVNTNSTKKWKCESTGEKSIYVVLQLDKPSVITGIDIGNEHAAFIEVLVGKNGSAADKYKEILLTSSFMTPVESRNSTNPNRVRCFTENALVESVAKQKWDLVKIICTQPFNNHVQYGLTFVTIHSLKELNNNSPSSTPNASNRNVKEQSKTSEKTQNTPSDKNHNKPSEKVSSKPNNKAVYLGKFRMREESSDSDTGANSLFARWKGAKENKSSTDSISSAAAIREASTTSSLKNSTNLINKHVVTPTATRDESPKSTSSKNSTDSSRKKDHRDNSSSSSSHNRNRDSLLYTNEDDQPNEKYDKRIAIDKERLKKESRSESSTKDHKSSVKKDHRKDNDNSHSSNQHNNSTSSKHDNSKEKSPGVSKKRTLSPPPNKNNDNSKKIKKDVIYKPFRKLMENVVFVMSGIQNPERDSIRRKALEMGATYKPDWGSRCTHLICAFKNTPKYKQVSGKGKIITKDWVIRCYTDKKHIPWRRFALDDKDADEDESETEIYDLSLKPEESPSPKSPIKSLPSTSHQTPRKLLANASSDSVELIPEKTPPIHILPSDSDTEDEIERIRLQNKKNTNDDFKVYAISTEDDGLKKNDRDTSNSPAPEIFKNKSFYIADNLKATDVIKLERSIPLHKGELKKSANTADYIISGQSVNTPSQFTGEIVEPLWIFECCDMECLIPTKRYLINRK